MPRTDNPLKLEVLKHRSCHPDTATKTSFDIAHRQFTILSPRTVEDFRPHLFRRPQVGPLVVSHAYADRKGAEAKAGTPYCHPPNLSVGTDEK